MSLIRPQAIGGRSLVGDYLQEEPSALSFFAGSPFRLDSFRRKLDEVRGRFGAEERRIAASSLRPTSARARERLARFVEEGGAMVTTGQQAGFLTGPLYTINKAAATIALTDHLESRLGVVVLPVFWVASEDHDWAEANHATLVDRKGRLRRFELAGIDPRPLPMSERTLGGDLEALLDEVAQAVGAAKNNREYLARILGAYREPGRSVGAAFGEAISVIFEEFDLLIADAADPAIKAASAGVLELALTEAASHERGLSLRTEALQDAGYAPQVSVLERGTNVFFRSDAGRERLYSRGDDFMVRERKGILAREDLLAQLRAEPELFSPNVLLRPVVESTVFPTLAYVGGPGEIAYFAQVTALFESYGVLPPVVVPRFSALVVEPAVERVLGELSLQVEDTVEGRERLLERLARDEVPDGVNHALASLRECLADGFERLIDEADEVDPTLVSALGSIRNQELAWLGRAERKVIQAVKRGDRIATDQLDRVLNALRPNGAPQERVLNVLPYLGRYGGHFLRELDRVIRESWRFPE